jgi:hypothetical protein
MEVMAFAGGLTALSGVYGIYVAIGAVSILARLTAIKLVIFVALCLYMVNSGGVEAVAWSYAITSFVVIPFVFFPLSKSLNISIYSYFNATVRPLFASLIMAITVRVFIDSASSFSPELNGIMKLIGAVFIGGLTYIALLLALWIASGKPRSIEFFCMKFGQEKLGVVLGKFW